MQLEYLDLYLIHWPVTGIPGPKVTPSLEETWAAMEELVREGLVRSIGVSNFSIKKIRQLLKVATIRPAVVQVRGLVQVSTYVIAVCLTVIVNVNLVSKPPFISTQIHCSRLRSTRTGEMSGSANGVSSMVCTSLRFLL